MDDVDLTVTTDGKSRGILMDHVISMSIAPRNDIIFLPGQNLSDAQFLPNDYDTTFFHINHKHYDLVQQMNLIRLLLSAVPAATVESPRTHYSD